MSGRPAPAFRLACFVLALALAPVAEAAPRGDPFPGRRQVSVAELFKVLAAQADVVGRSPEVRRDYDAFLREQGLGDDPALYRDFVRIRLAFEATRAGGLWGLRWQITDQQPQSDRVWTQWQSLRVPDTAEFPATTAFAECDELSALFAFVARGTGLSKRSETGLFWPASNHTVAVWTIDRGKPSEKRIVVPTSQIFLDARQSLGTRAFDPWRQKNIYSYRRQDAASDLSLPAPLARQFVLAIAASGARPQARLQELRNAREQRQ